MNNERMKQCMEFFDGLKRELSGTYEQVGSCNRDLSSYLVPSGTSSEITYYGKPDQSFRVSDHWNWFSNMKKCRDEHYIQCYSRDLPFARKREESGKASRPILAACVCLFRNGIYEVVYGEKFDRKTKTWTWIDNTPENVCRMMKGAM